MYTPLIIAFILLVFCAKMVCDMLRTIDGFYANLDEAQFGYYEYRVIPYNKRGYNRKPLVACKTHTKGPYWDANSELLFERDCKDFEKDKYYLVGYYSIKNGYGNSVRFGMIVKCISNHSNSMPQFSSKLPSDMLNSKIYGPLVGYRIGEECYYFN